jgi:MFS family permease
LLIFDPTILFLSSDIIEIISILVILSLNFIIDNFFIIFAIFNGGGRPVFGALTDRLTPRNTALLSFVLIAAASALLWQMPSVPVYILSFAILWGCLGGWLAIAPTATGSYFGTCDYPRCYGIVFLAYGAGAIAGPQLAGFIKTTTGNYLGVFPYVLVLALTLAKSEAPSLPHQALLPD